MTADLPDLVMDSGITLAAFAEESLIQACDSALLWIDDKASSPRWKTGDTCISMLLVVEIVERRKTFCPFTEFRVPGFTALCCATRSLVCHENTRRWLVCCYKGLEDNGFWDFERFVIYCISMLSLHMESINSMIRVTRTSYKDFLCNLKHKYMYIGCKACKFQHICNPSYIFPFFSV